MGSLGGGGGRFATTPTFGRQVAQGWEFGRRELRTVGSPGDEGLVGGQGDDGDGSRGTAGTSGKLSGVGGVERSQPGQVGPLHLRGKGGAEGDIEGRGVKQQGPSRIEEE